MRITDKRTRLSRRALRPRTYYVPLQNPLTVGSVANGASESPYNGTNQIMFPANRQRSARFGRLLKLGVAWNGDIGNQIGLRWVFNVVIPWNRVVV
jgi:hypothetical protein